MKTIEGAVRAVVDLLVAGDYVAIERSDEGGLVSAEEIGTAVAEYGRTLATPEEGWFDAVALTRAVDSSRPRFHADVPLWTVEDGRSDLTLELQITELVSGGYATTVLGIHVL